jgi:hypothetical protein
VDSEILIAVVLFATVLLRFGLVAILAYALLPRGLECPMCGRDLLPIAHTFLNRLVPQLRHGWCLGCGWQGVMRRATPPAFPASPPPQPAAPPPVTWM